MPPRHAYWTIIVDDQPTAFRAHDPEELLPTLNRLREKNPTAVMKWFERGKLFESRDEARDAGLGQGERRWEGPRPDRDDEGPRFGGRGGEPRRGDAGPEGDRGQTRAPRDKNWRPGGEHRDPRQKYKDAKKAKWNRFKDKIRERHEERGPRNPETFTPPHGDKFRQPAAPPDEARAARDRRPEWRDERGERDERPSSRKPREAWGAGPATKPHGDKLAARPAGPAAPARPAGPAAPARPAWRREDSGRGGFKGGGDRERRPWSDRPPRRDENREQRAWSDRPPRREGDRDQRAWSDRPPRRENDRGQRPWSDRPPRRENDRAQRPWSDRPPRRENDRDQRPWSDRPPRREADRDERPWNDRPPRRDDARGGSSSRPREDSGGWRPKGPGGGRKPAGTSDRKSWGSKPGGAGERKPWSTKPPGGGKKSWGSKPPGRSPAGGRPPRRRRDRE
jgi:23S rRNA pseudouridine2605 synthase